MAEKKIIFSMFVAFATVMVLIPEVTKETLVVAGAWTAIAAIASGAKGDRQRNKIQR